MPWSQPPEYCVFCYQLHHIYPTFSVYFILKAVSKYVELPERLGYEYIACRLLAVVFSLMRNLLVLHIFLHQHRRINILFSENRYFASTTFDIATPYIELTSNLQFQMAFSILTVALNCIKAYQTQYLKTIAITRYHKFIDVTISPINCRYKANIWNLILFCTSYFYRYVLYTSH